VLCAGARGGRNAKRQAELFAGEQYGIIGSHFRSVAHLISDFAGELGRDLSLSVVQSERPGTGCLARAGLSGPHLQAYESVPGAHAYTEYMAWLALYGSAAEVAAAYLVNFRAWGENCDG